MDQPRENEDQRTLRAWITAGLSIRGVRELRGDAGYLLNNMIAKYTLAADAYRLSMGALGYLEDHGFPLTDTYRRRRFYGKKSPLLYEHAIPAAVVRKQLLERLGQPVAPDEVASVLASAGEVCVLLRDSEDRLLRVAGLNAAMPPGWAFGDDPFARYRMAGIEMSPVHLRVTGAIVR